jgi:squalene cyclase
MTSVRGLFVAVAAVLALLVATPSAPARAEERIARTDEFRKHVDEMIAKGVAWLLAQQKPDGCFTTDDFDRIETTARAYHALRVSRVERTHPAMAKAYAALQ